MLYSVYAVLGVCCTWCMLYSGYAVLGVCCTRCMLCSVYTVLDVCCIRCIISSPSFRQKYPGVLVDSASFDGTSYHRMGKYTLPVTEVTYRIAYIPPLLCALICTIHMTHVLHSSQGLQLCCSRLHNAWQCLCLFPDRVPHFTSPQLLYIGCRTLPIYVWLCDVVTNYNTVIASDP